MELNEFTSLTLTEIQQGVQNAAVKAREAGTSGVINPVWGDADDINKSHIKHVQFDIAITVDNKSTTGGEAGMKAWGLNIGGS